MQQTVAASRSAKPTVAVHILRGRSSRASREMIDDDLLIGSGSDCDVQMRSVDIAERHCLIARSGRQVTIRRLHPEFPVMVNDKSVSGCRLDDGDRLKIGPFELKVAIGKSSFDNDSRHEIDDELPGEAEEDSKRDVDHESELSEPSPSPSRGLVGGPSVERRLKIVAEQLERIEQQRGELDQLRAKIEQRQSALDRDHKDQARRNQELTRLETEIQRRHQQVQELEQSIENQRLNLTDEALNVDARKRDLLTGKEKFFRVRRKAFDIFRSRRGELESAQIRAETQAAELKEAFARFEQERHSWRQLGEQNERTQQDLQAKLDELGQRFDQVDRERTRLASDRQQLDVEVRDLRQKEASLRLFETEIGQKHAAIDGREAELAKQQVRFSQDVQRLHAGAAELERRTIELEAESQRVEANRREVERRLAEAGAVEGRLIDRQKQLDSAIADFNRASHARTVEFELLGQSIKSEQDLLKRRLAEAEERERFLETDAGRQQAENERLSALAEKISRETASVERKSKDLEEHARRIVATCDNERKTLDNWRNELENEVRLRARERESFETHKQRWSSRFCRVRESACEMAQRRAILTARELRLVAESQRQSQRGELLTRKESELLQQCEQLQVDRSEVHALQMELARKAAELTAESKRLDSLGHDLEGRHAKLFERERTWRDEVQRKRQDLEQVAGRLEKRQQLLDRQTTLHGRHLEKIRQIGLDTLDKRKQAKSEVEKVIARHEEYQSQLEDARARQREVLTEVLSQIEMAGRRDREANAWLDRIKSENDSLLQLQADFATAIEQMLGRLPSSRSLPIDDPSAVVPLELSPSEVESWRSKIAACLDRLERYAGTLAEREKHLEAARVEEQTSKQQLQSLFASIAATEAMMPQPNDRPELKVVAADFDETAGPSTVAKMQPASGLPAGELPIGEATSIGNAKIQRLVHRGSVATTYLAQLPNLGEAVALRIYGTQWCRDPKLRAVYESGIKSFSQMAHPNIVKTLGFFAAGDQYGVASEWIEGKSLQQLKRGDLTPKGVARWLDQCLDGLAFTHSSGYVHRCLGPGKIMIDANDRVRILGFGEPSWLVNLRRCEQPKAQLAFVAPESQNGGPGDTRSDLFSLGRIFIALVEAMRAKFAGSGSPATEWVALRAVAEKLAAPLPGNRFADANLALAELRATFKPTHRPESIDAALRNAA